MASLATRVQLCQRLSEPRARPHCCPSDGVPLRSRIDKDLLLDVVDVLALQLVASLLGAADDLLD